MSTYVELHAHSSYSLLDGASSIEALVSRAVALKMPSLALTDHDALYGAVQFTNTAKSAGLHPILGAELTLDDKSHLTLLVENEMGWGNLCWLISRARMNAPKGSAALPADALEGHTAGLIALSGCRKGQIATALRQKHPERANAAAQRLLSLFGRDHLWIELQHHHLPGDDLLCYQLVALARRFKLGYVATNNVHYAEQFTHELQDILVCIKHNLSLDEAIYVRRENSEYYLKSAEQMSKLFAHYPGAISNTLSIAERCQFTPHYGLQELPAFPTPDGLDAIGYLRQLCIEALPRRYANVSTQHTERLDHELGVIQRSGLANYFLIVWNLVDYARRNGIRCQGRGSAANSLVAFLLYISPIDPIAHGLVFERFLSDERNVAPDIDLDFAAPNARETLIRYIYDRYGQDYAAMACTFVTFRAKSAFRDVGKALGFPPLVLDGAAKALDTWDAAGIATSASLREYLGERVLEPSWQQLMRLCGQIANYPHHLGIHNGGFILSGKPLVERVPVEPARMQGRTVIQWDKESLESAGLIKIDVLGLRMLAAISDAVDLIRQDTGQVIDIDNLQFNDPAVYDMVSAAQTLGVFQVESRAQAQVLPKMQPRRFEDIVVTISLIRPGPILGQMVHPYLRRRVGLERVTYPHPLLGPVLSETLGVVLFQEQVLQTANALAGFTPGQGELLRRALGSKNGQQAVEKFESAFLSGAAGKGVPESVANLVFGKLRSFGSYSFSKAHAAAFAVIVYQSAWLKRYFAPYFLAALLSNEPLGFWSPAVLVNSARKDGIKVLRVDINYSEYRCTVQNGVMRLGLMYIRGLGQQDGKIIQDKRERAPFDNLEDFCRRTKLNRDIIQNLIWGGAFDSWGIPRRRLLWELGTLRYLSDELPLRFEQHDVKLPELSEQEERAAELAVTGIELGQHIMSFYREQLTAQGILDSKALDGCRNGQEVQVGGLLLVHQSPPSAKGVHFLTLDTEQEMVNVIVKPGIYASSRAVIRTSPLLICKGTVQRQGKVINVVAQSIRNL